MTPFEYGDDLVSQMAKQRVLEEADRAARVANLRQHIARHHYAMSTVGLPESVLTEIHKNAPEQGSHE